MVLEPATDGRCGPAPGGSGGAGTPVGAPGPDTVALEQLDERYGELRLSRPSVVAALRRSIEREGLLQPMLANLERDGKLALLDGFKRLHALRDLNRQQAAIRVMQFDEISARAAVMSHNAPHRGLCELEQAWVVRSLVRGCRLRQSEVAERLGRHKSWVCRRLALCEQLCGTVQQDIRLGLVSATMARELARLPRGNQAQVAAAIREHHLSSRQCSKLVDHALRCENVRALDALLRDPWPRLTERKAEEPTADPRLGPVAESLRGRLIGLERSASWLIESLPKHPTTVALSNEEIDVLAELARSCGERCQEAVAGIAEHFCSEPSS